MTMDDVQRTVGSNNAFLEELVRNRLSNSTPPLRREIRNRDELVRLKEEERRRVDFYRTTEASHKARIKKLDDATIMFLEDLVAFNKQVHESCVKSDKAKDSYHVTYRANWRLSQRIEIAQLLCCKLKLYETVLKTRLNMYEEVVVKFLEDVAAEMRLDTISMVPDRHTTLRFMHQELYQEYNKNTTELNKLKEKQAAYISHMDKKIILQLNEMVSKRDRLNFIKNEVIHREGEIAHLMFESSSTNLDIYHLKTAIHGLYKTLQACRGADAEPIESIEALEFIQYHFLTLKFAVDEVRALTENTTNERRSKATAKGQLQKSTLRSKHRKGKPIMRSDSIYVRSIFESDVSSVSVLDDRFERDREISFNLPGIADANKTDNATAEAHRRSSSISLPHTLKGGPASTNCCKLPNVSIKSTVAL